MATKTITIKESAYRALVKCKEANESFSDVIEREFLGKIDTADDLLNLSRRLRREGRRFGFIQKRKSRIRAA
jgi:predicted CopG family antitoxin